MENNELYGFGNDDTVSLSKEESIMKALAMIQGEGESMHKEPLRRPKVNFVKIIAWNILWLAVLAGCYCALYFLSVNTTMCVLLTVLVFLVISVINAKRIIITLVRIYQRFAPETVRRACVFEPTCSQYMILAVEKYGAFKGAAKGINRLLRCRSHNSGVDYP